LKDTRVGESLWQQWHGYGYYPTSDESEIVYFTEEHVDMDNEIVRRALASNLQRDGIADSLSNGFSMIENATIQTGWAGFLEEETEFTYCDEQGETEYGDIVEKTISITWIEF
jgi:hypothetical protein